LLQNFGFPSVKRLGLYTSIAWTVTAIPWITGVKQYLLCTIHAAHAKRALFELNKHSHAAAAAASLVSSLVFAERACVCKRPRESCELTSTRYCGIWSLLQAPRCGCSGTWSAAFDHGLTGY